MAGPSPDLCSIKSGVEKWLHSVCQAVLVQQVVEVCRVASENRFRKSKEQRPAETDSQLENAVTPSVEGTLVGESSKSSIVDQNVGPNVDVRTQSDDPSLRRSLQNLFKMLKILILQMEQRGRERGARPFMQGAQSLNHHSNELMFNHFFLFWNFFGMLF